MIDPDLKAALQALPERAALHALWTSLEARATPSFFTSWSWIGTWLAQLPPTVLSQLQLLHAQRGGVTMGLAVVARGPDKQRLGLPFCRTAFLHATGRPEFDTLTVEHNGFLLAQGQEAPVRHALLNAWLQGLPGATEITLPGLAGTGWPDGCEQGLSRRLTRHDWVRPSYAVDLVAVRAAQGDFLSLLSSNTRSQIRRSLKEYGKLGPVQVESARDVEQALAWLDALAALHQSHWVARGQPGAFSNPFFTAFHRALVQARHGQGEIQLLRIQAGAQDLGYLYSFVLNGRVYFYQSGFAYDLIEKHSRPGLVAHVLGVQHNASLGHQVYDFMAGESRYKLNLATLPEQMTWTTLRTKAWRFSAEAALRQYRENRRVRQGLRQTPGNTAEGLDPAKSADQAVE